MVCSVNWSWFSEARGEPTCVCGRVWVELLELEITLLTDVPEAIMDLVVVTWGALSPQASIRGELTARDTTFSRAHACAGAVMVPRPQTDEVTSPSL
jgi:hypothetical protein